MAYEFSQSDVGRQITNQDGRVIGEIKLIVDTIAFIEISEDLSPKDRASVGWAVSDDTILPLSEDQVEEKEGKLQPM